MTVTSARVLGEATVQELRESVDGEVVAPSDPGYAEACKVWNGAHDRRPALVVRCATAGDVATAVGFARSNDLQIAVRGGGHSIAGFSTCDNGIVIDLSQMNDVHVDPATRRATVGGGAVWADVDNATQPHSLATMTIRPSPVVALNRAIAIAQHEGPQRGLEEIRTIADRDRLATYTLLPRRAGQIRISQREI